MCSLATSHHHGIMVGFLGFQKLANTIGMLLCVNLHFPEGSYMVFRKLFCLAHKAFQTWSVSSLGLLLAFCPLYLPLLQYTPLEIPRAGGPLTPPGSVRYTSTSMAPSTRLRHFLCLPAVQHSALHSRAAQQWNCQTASCLQQN